MGGFPFLAAWGASTLTNGKPQSDPAGSGSMPDPARVSALLRQASDNLRRARQEATEPIAVVGMGCRFPGAASIDAYWDLLAAGRSGVSTVPTDRWDADALTAPGAKQAGKITSNRAGFIDRVDQFDGQFFGISDREAASLDPQHRLLMEVAWETLERAGVDPDRYADLAAGVFLGICSNDYLQLLSDRGREEIDAYLGTGNAHSAAAGRLSYFLKWQGPSVAVDTACSSSLTAVHYAVQSLRTGDCEIALAGGVNLILTPELSINLSQAGMLSPRGECSSFTRAADGFVRGEGCGMVLLKRLRKAVEDGDRIWSVLRGTAVNQDGRSNGLTAPNGPSQQSVIRRALKSSGLKPKDIDYLEAHGTGTELGDPTEMAALAAVFGGDAAEGRSGPLQVGSAKANIGHLEGAAGIAGLIKTCLSLHHQQMPPHPSFDPTSSGPEGPSDHIDWSQPIQVPHRLTPWNQTESRVRGAGVSSFGFGGTNAHVVVEAAPQTQAVFNHEEFEGHEGVCNENPRWVTLSAKSEKALNELAESYRDELPEAPLEAIAYAANAGRASHSHRLAIGADDLAQLKRRLDEWVATQETNRETLHGIVTRDAATGWLFGGQGGCRPGMGRELYARFETFRNAWDRCDEILREQWPRSLSEICWENPQRWLAEVDTQLALVSWQISLAELWTTWARPPQWVIGHSLGEFAAAVTAGMLTREDALRIVCRRAELVDSLEERGAMLAVMASAEQVEPLLTNGLSLASLNGPRQTVVSGGEQAIAQFEAKLTETRTRSKRLATSHAFHSPIVDPIVQPLTDACRDVESCVPRLGFLSTLTGQPITAALPADYWARQLREPVRFDEAMQHAPAETPKLELSPTPVLRGLAGGGVSAASGWQPGEEVTVAEATSASLWTAGVPINFKQVHPRQTLSVTLPTYPWQRRRHWFELKHPARSEKPQNDHLPTPAGEQIHPLLGAKLDLASDDTLFETDLTLQPWLADHRLRGEPTLPAVAYGEMALAAATEADANRRWSVRDLQLLRPIRWPENASCCRVQTVCSLDEDGNLSLLFKQREPSGWVLAGQCQVVAGEESETQIPSIDSSLMELRDVDLHYRKCAEAGLDYGPAFQGVSKLAGATGTATAMIQLPAELSVDGYLLHPSLADAALQTIAAAMPAAWQDSWVPKGIERITVGEQPDRRTPLEVIARIETFDSSRVMPSELTANVWLLSESGTLRAALLGVQLVRMAGAKQENNLANHVTKSAQSVQEDEEKPTLDSLRAASSAQRAELLLQEVRRQLALVMDMPVSELQPAQPLDALGLDSLMAFELRDELQESLGTEIPMDVFLQRMNLRELAELIQQQFEAAVAAGDVANEESPTENWIEGAL